MLQINVMPYASDALEDAMRLAQTKALNSFSFSDCLNYLNYAWSDIYNRMACIDHGYYSRIVPITQKHTKLPPFVKNAVTVFRAQSPDDHSREVYRASGYDDLGAHHTYHVSGTDLYVPDAGVSKVFLEYVPACPFVTFTKNNRDPIIHDTYERNTGTDLYNINKVLMYSSKEQHDEEHLVPIDGTIESVKSIIMHNRATNEEVDVSNKILLDDYTLTYIKLDYPYIFVSYVHKKMPEKHMTGFFDRNLEFNLWNGFDFTGRETNVELLDARYNDKTGMGVVLKDWNDLKTETTAEGVITVPTIKELGWTPDTMLSYPAPEMYRYLVALLASKFSALNESNVMGVQRELVEAKYAFEAFISKDKAAWQRIRNVNGSTLGDYIV